MILNGNDPIAIAQAAQALLRGELLGLPTETVYGLAADAGNDAAVKAIFHTKGRPSDHPLIVHVAHAQGAQHFASEVPEFAQRLMDAFWPGPLTLILPRQTQVAALAAGGQDSVGLRCPAHPVAQAVLQAAEGLGVRGVAAPSANRFGRVSPTTAAHVAAELGDDLLIVDGGACEVGIESTIIDCTRGQPVLLRPGVLTPAELSAACGLTVRLPTQEADADAPRASGTLASHYAPSARVCLLPLAQLQQALQVEAKAIAQGLGQAQRLGQAIGQVQRQGQLEGLAHAPAPTQHTTADAANAARWVVWTRSLSGPDASWPAGVRWVNMPKDPAQCAHELFAQLRAFDDAGITHIWVESPPPAPEWAGVLDRLSRAASPDR